jgi:hypothetical protein
MTVSDTPTKADPKLEQLAKEISGAFKGGPGPSKDFSISVGNRDAAQFAASLLAAYQTAAVVNPRKAIRPPGKAFNTLTLEDPAAVVGKDFWHDFLSIVSEVAPVVINALSKDYEAPRPVLRDVIDALPAERRDDKSWTDFATQLLLIAAKTTVQALSGEKDFSHSSDLPDLPQPPDGKDKDFFADAMHFVAQAAPVVMPIIMSFL